MVRGRTRILRLGARRADAERSWGVARKGGEPKERGQYKEVQTRDEGDASCRERRQVVRRAAPPPGRTTAQGRSADTPGVAGVEKGGEITVPPLLACLLDLSGEEILVHGLLDIAEDTDGRDTERREREAT